VLHDDGLFICKAVAAVDSSTMADDDRGSLGVTALGETI